MPTRSQLDRFIAAVHRRAVGVRVGEYAGLGLLAAAGVAAVLALALRRFDWLTVLVFAGAAAGLGMVAGFQRRPTPLDSVVEADRQLQLDDLLSSAMTAGDDPFGRAVRAMAERRCATLSPSAVAVNRFGGRTWGAIGLAWAIVLVLGLLSGGPSDSLAGSDATAAIVPPLRDRQDVQPLVQSPADHRPGAGTGVDEPRDFGDAPGQAGREKPVAARGNENTGQGASGAGGGTAATDNARAAAPGTGDAPAGNPSDTGDTAGGTGMARPGVGVGATAGTAARFTDRDAAPWRSDQWPAARATALQAVRDGRVPDAYRDVVRAYFDPAE